MSGLDDFGSLDDSEDVSLNQYTAQGIRDRQAAYQRVKDGAKGVLNSAASHAKRAASSVYGIFNKAKTHIGNWVSHQAKAAMTHGNNLNTMLQEHNKHKHTLHEQLKHAKSKLHERAQHLSGFLGVHEVITGVKHATSATTRAFHKHTGNALTAIANTAQKAAMDQSKRSADAYDRRADHRHELAAIGHEKKDALEKLHGMHKAVEETMSHLTDVHSMHSHDPTQHTSYAEHHHDDDAPEDAVMNRAKTFVSKLHSKAKERMYGTNASHISAEFESLDLEPVGTIHDGKPSVEGKLHLPNFHVMHHAGVDRQDADHVINVCTQALYNAHHGHLTMSMMVMWSMMTAIQSQMILLLGLQHSKFEYIHNHGFDKVLHMALNSHEPHHHDHNSSVYEPHKAPTHTAYDYMPTQMTPMNPMMPMPMSVKASPTTTIDTPKDGRNPYLYPGA